MYPGAAPGHPAQPREQRFNAQPGPGSSATPTARGGRGRRRAPSTGLRRGPREQVGEASDQFAERGCGSCQWRTETEVDPVTEPEMACVVTTDVENVRRRVLRLVTIRGSQVDDDLHRPRG